MAGYKTLYVINGKRATDDDYYRLEENTQTAMRVMRVLSFEYAD